MNIPQELLYTREHEWIRLEGRKATIGITDFAQSQLGDVVFVELPAAGAAITSGQAFSVVESVKAVSDIFAPVSGVIVTVNEMLADQPELVNQDPYGEGWIAVVELPENAVLEGLLSSGDYVKMVAEGGH
ncbi:glycine cleavage system h-protein [Lucifera butyrica]|uniref:Glycine cleavage system H protein n=1 Tax=Lucifera butyrica TaxID=1351585 RepID=A0A498RAW1_9FIRM|nr:glycine cleavage system protein GcvH [Lucifera butyrica]VBB08349.1 glycine cleavage system h-protein [Lucifera butyrica]